MAKVAEAPRKKYRFQVLVGRHIAGWAKVDPDTGEHVAVTDEYAQENRNTVVPGAYYRGGPLGDIVETDINLARKFNQYSKGPRGEAIPISVKFKLISVDDDIVREIDDGFEQMSVKELLSYVQAEEIPFEATEAPKKADLLKAIRSSLVTA